MSGPPPSASQQGECRKGGPGGESSRGGGRVEVYLHAVTDEQAALLQNTESICLLDEVRTKSGADVNFDVNSSPVLGRKVVTIRGVPSQIDEAVKLINQKLTLSEQAQTFWLQWVEAAFPDLDSDAYFLPPVYFNRMPMTSESIAGESIMVLQPAPGKAGQSNKQAMTPPAAGQAPRPQPPRVLDSDTRDDAAMNRVLMCLQTMSKQNKEVLVGLSQLKFGQYLSEPCYSAAVAQLPVALSLPPCLPRNWKQGDFDVLLLHRHFGLVVLEVKTFGDNLQALKMPQQKIDNNIKQKLKDAASQLDKAEAMLSHLVSDIAPGLRITKTIAFPNLTARQLQQAISSDTHIVQDLCLCLGTTDPSDIPEDKIINQAFWDL
ncbi:uncharacterized protein LOC112554830 [Pomacea canaliculata]|uniref:uncharacterized protein LOC112554830 n=1 Tax=Pomacea canaliculata TaxID=400727 RepID=UPI000D7374B8|nr:uncharacterized protein LOC112554830 [Pomacea canaliculata]